MKFSVLHLLGTVCRVSLVLAAIQFHYLLAIALCPFLFGIHGSQWWKQSKRSLIVDLLSSIFWTAVFAFFGYGFLSWIYWSNFGFAGYIRSHSSVEVESIMLKYEIGVVAVAALVAFMGGYVGGVASSDGSSD